MISSRRKGRYNPPLQMSQTLPPGQGPVDPQPAFSAPPRTPPNPPGGWAPPPFGAPPRMPPGFPGGPPPWFRPPRQGGFILRLILALLLLVILIDLVILNLGLLGAAVTAANGTNVRKVTIVSGPVDSTVAVLPVEGLITDATAQEFDTFLTAATDDKSVKAIVLSIDTPGGSASASDAMYHRLQLFKTQAQQNGQAIPVIATMGGMGTSGGYYVACGADYIFAEPATLTANIGVLFPRFNVSELMDKYGIKETTIVASGCYYKNLGSMFSPESEQGRAYLQGLVDGTFDQFKSVVRANRKKLPADQSDIFNGRVYLAPDALKLGLIDQIGYADAAYTYAKKAANISDAKVVRYMPPTELQQLLDSDSVSNVPAGQAQSSDRTISVGNLSIDSRQLLDLLSPRPMYLWMGN